MSNPSKGERLLLGTRPLLPVTKAAQKRRVELGYPSMSDYIAALIARDVQMPDLAPKPVSHSTYEELPIADVA
ncbi:toxin-antitoxin system [Clavibacter sp. VKM Ac-2872]|uniref:toxin-antitoxin system n=1 Tax=Clavibacter sp. VKM Ac-2872 TaxID=2783812 RepID=UPI00188C8C33|nr:toxin-antitoxin system [Clavibacter sp. VKM Ac-2872]MBF4625833.1 toxin-antitoxin system [Clavibacter sp. VKM Ac-2872]